VGDAVGPAVAALVVARNGVDSAVGDEVCIVFVRAVPS
jgi:hypothetical protein